MKAMEAQFKGKGLDKTLFESGIDTTQIDFTKLNGLIGKVGNTLGATKHILADQDAYRAKAAEWRKDWEKSQTAPVPAPADFPEITSNTPDPRAAGFARDELRKQPAAAMPRPASHQEAASMATGAAASRA